MPALSRRSLLRCGALVTTVPLAIAASSCTRDEQAPDDADATDDSAEETEVAEGGASLRPRMHLTPPSGWLGDPQRPVLRDGTVHLYGLHHAEDTAPGPTTWSLWTSTDLVAFEHQGTALEGSEGIDVWSGSAVVDEQDTAGLGAGTTVALMTRPTDGRAELQEQYLASSVDAATFTLEASPVLRNAEGPRAGTEEEKTQASWFRDPKLQRDEDRGQWVCAIARDHRVAFWTSPDLRSWEQREDFAYLDLAPDLPDLGGVECPDLFTLTADDGTTHWVLGASLDGSGAGEPTNYAYWVGTWDGERFTPEDPAPRWLDRGWDWYAAVTWPSAEDPEHLRHAIGWMNNWAYARERVPTASSDGYDGQYSVVREVRLLRDEDGTLTLTSQPIPALAAAATTRRALEDRTVEDETDLGDLGPAFALEMDLSWDDASEVGLTVLGSEDGSRGTRVTLGSGLLTVDRTGSAASAQDDGSAGDDVDEEGSEAPFAGLTAASAPIDPEARSAYLHVLVDMQSVEVFLDDGRTALSLTVHPDPGEGQVRLHTTGGNARATGLQVRTH